jgi:predicted kinase
MNKPTFYIMIGLSASGKSTIAEQIAEAEDCIIVSTDKIRGEICDNGVIDQTRNEDVFKIFHTRIKENLAKGISVIADATNINMKARRSLLENVKKIDCYKVAYIVPKSVEKCIDDNIYKDYPVPHHVIQKQMMNFQIPFIEEGFDKIVIHKFEDAYINHVFIGDCYEFMSNFDQQNPHHTMSLGDHCKFTMEQFKSMSDYIYTEYPFASSLHDIGKLFTQKFDDNGVAHYYQHENVGCYYLLSNIENIKQHRDYSDEEILNILFLVNYHMMPMSWDSEKAKNTWKRRFGEYKYQLLLDFNACDKAR